MSYLVLCFTIKSFLQGDLKNLFPSSYVKCKGELQIYIIMGKQQLCLENKL